MNRIRDLLLDDATLRSPLLPEERKATFETAECCLVAKALCGSRVVDIEAGHYIPLPELHKSMEECLQGGSKGGAWGRAMILLVWQLGPRVHEIVGLTLKSITLTEGIAPGYFARAIGKGNKQHPV